MPVRCGDRVRWEDTEMLDGSVLPAGTGYAIGRDNVHWLVRSDEVVAQHDTWTEHRLVKLINVQPE